MRKILLVVLLVCFTQLPICWNNPKTDFLRKRLFSPCKSCRIYTRSFEKAMEKTSKGKFEGGDTAWEEEKLGSYVNSEIRFVETQEHVCTDIEEGKDQCYSFNEQHDEIIEDWWFNYQSKQPDLFKYFCIDSIKLCCPEFHYGPHCLPCQGYPDNICSNSGKCNGSGTRKGNGKCNCDLGYTSENCDSCDEGYYTSYNNNSRLLCLKCHVSCDGPCSAAGPEGCEKCGDGWFMHNNEACKDIDECNTFKLPCHTHQFCKNLEGTYNCLACDPSCATCKGDGAHMCTSCADNLTFKDGFCINSSWDTRYQLLIPIILCFITYVLWRPNAFFAVIILYT